MKGPFLLMALKLKHFIPCTMYEKEQDRKYKNDPSKLSNWYYNEKDDYYIDHLGVRFNFKYYSQRQVRYNPNWQYLKEKTKKEPEDKKENEKDSKGSSLASFLKETGLSKKEFFEKHISGELEQCINQRTTVIADRKENTFIPMLQDNETENYNYQLITPIISEGDVMGAVIFLSQDKKMGELEGKLAQSAAGFLGKQMEQ